MKKVENMQFKFRVLVVMLVVVAVAIQIPYAFASSSFFEVSSTQIGQGETLALTLNLSEVNYDEFEFKLTSTIKIDEMYTSEDVDVEETSSDYTIVIGIDKTQISSEQITLYYPISEDTAVGTIIELTAQIITDVETEVEVEDTNTTSTSGTENTTVVEEGSENTTTAGTVEEGENTTNTEAGTTTTTTTTTTVVTETIVDEITIEVEVVEATENDMMNMSGNMTGNMMMDGMNMSMNMMDMDKMNMMGNMTMNMTMENMTDVTSSSTSSTNTVTYNGSDNNYLSSLEIDGVELNTTFNKENTTYFVTVENMDSLDITATADSSTAKVRITGDDDLQEGENKVLITVTAENGNVRYYRIYVTNNITD